MMESYWLLGHAGSAHPWLDDVGMDALSIIVSCAYQSGLGLRPLRTLRGNLSLGSFSYNVLEQSSGIRFISPHRPSLAGP
jgi:hypothetical protein